MKNRFSSNLFWITGASSGIGRELSIQLALQGASLVLSSRDTGELENLKMSLYNPSKHTVCKLDLIDSQGIENAVKQIFNENEKVDFLVNCAGVSQRSSCLETSEAVDRRIMEIDYFGTVKLSKLVAGKMLERKSGTIVTIGSIAGKVGLPNRSAYAAAKHAITGFMDCLRSEITPLGVRVLVIHPGWVKTNISKNALTGDMQKFGNTDLEIQNGMPVKQCVDRIVNAIESKKEEMIIATGMPRLAYHTRRLFPSLYHKLLRKIYTKT